MKARHGAEFLDPAAFSMQPTCPICGGEASRVGSSPTIHPRSTAVFALLSCRGCGHWWHDPLPTQEFLNRCYRDGSLSVLGEGWEQGVVDRRAEAPPDDYHHWVIEEERRRTPLRYLELGLGDGRLFAAFERLGCSCVGVEPGAWGRGRKNVVEDLSQVPAGESFDVAAALDVLEHVFQPAAVLGALASRLKPGGRLHASFPNSRSLGALVFGARWHMVRPLGHLHYFSRESLTRLLTDSGFALVKARQHEPWPGLARVPRQAARHARGRDVSGAFVAIARGAVSSAARLVGAGDQWTVTAERR
jgi:SAM-dependent methyltransferase